VPLLLAALLAAAPTAADRPAPPATQPAAARPRVYVGVYLNDITKFDQKDGIFDVDVVLWAKWLGDFNQDAIIIANAANVKQTLLGAEADGPWRSVRWAVKGTLRGEFPVHRFPFDHQNVAVVLELPAREGELVPDLVSSGMRERFSVAGWNYDPLFRPRVAEELYRTDLGQIRSEGEPTRVQRVSFGVTMRRPAVAVGLKFFLPLGIIALVALVALFIHPSVAAARASIGVTSLLSCFAFQFSVGGSMPPVSYITLADTVFMIAYAFCMLGLSTTVASHYLHQNKHEETALRLDQRARVLLPLAALVAVLLLSLRSPPERAATPAAPAAPTAATVSSTRDVVRIGTTIKFPLGLTAALYGAQPRAVGDEVPAHLEEVPGVSSDNLRFLAGGRLEVRWRLKPGLKWSDGHPATAGDVAFAHRASPHPNVRDVKVHDDRVVTITWDDRLSEALRPPAIFPRHALEPAFQRGGFAELEKQVRNTAVPGLGPYRVAASSDGQLDRLERNPHYAGAPAVLAKIEFKRFPDGRAAAAAFESGAIDVALPNTLSLEEARALAQRRPDAVTIRTGATHLLLQPDIDHPLLAQHAVRRAILQAIDRDAIRREIHGAAGAVAHLPRPGPLPAGTVTYAYDPAAARAALQAAGAVGAEIPLYFRSLLTERRTAERVAAYLAAVGLKIQMKTTDDLGSLYLKRKHGGLLTFVMRVDDEMRATTIWNLPRAGGRDDLTARHAAFDDATARLVAREAHALFPERRTQLRDSLYAAYSRRLPSLPLLFASERLVADPSLRGWDPGPRGAFGANTARWYFAAPAPAAPAPAAPAPAAPAPAAPR
jgi:ABC-type transport system substrate-binding protein